VRTLVYALKLEAAQPLVLQGEAATAASPSAGRRLTQYSQPYFTASGTITLGGRSVAVSGRAWMDREWSSQPLASDQTGWDWFSLHLDGGDKVIAFRLRQKDGGHYFAGNWIDRAGRSEPLPTAAIAMTPAASPSRRRKVPTAWRLAVAGRGLAIDCTPAQPAELDGHALRLLGRPDPLQRQPRRHRLSGDDGVLKIRALSPRHCEEYPDRRYAPSGHRLRNEAIQFLACR